MPNRPVLRSERANCNFDSGTGIIRRQGEVTPPRPVRPARPARIMTTFFVNPYNQELNISTREHQKLYTDGCQGIDKDERFDGNPENYESFLKLIMTKMETIRVKTCLKVSTE